MYQEAKLIEVFDNNNDKTLYCLNTSFAHIVDRSRLMPVLWSVMRATWESTSIPSINIGSFPFPFL